MADASTDPSTTARFEGSPAVMATYSGELETVGDVDWVRVTLQATGIYHFFGSASSAGVGSGDCYMFLYDSNSNEVAGNNDASGTTQNSFFEFTAPASGDYFVSVRNADGLPAAYALVVKFKESIVRTSTGHDTILVNSGSAVGDRGDDDISLSGSSLTALGEQGDDVLIGNSSVENRISGGLGNDTIRGGPWNDRLFGDAGQDEIEGNGGDDLIYGGPGADWLKGGGGNDKIFSGEGADAAYGGAGNDEFHVDDPGDRVDDPVGFGTDVVFTSVSYTLPIFAEIEFVETENPLSTAPLNLTGSFLDNSLTGNNGANVLDGGEGQDVLSGLLGNDVYVLGNGSDSVIDSGGIDTATSTITRSLLVGGLTAIENLTLLGATAANGIGNARANVITGNNAINTLDGGVGNDTLKGLGGNDVLVGGAGKDAMAGGLGNDLFRYAAASQSAPGALADVIADFDRAGNDAIDLRGVYGGVLAYRHNAAFTGAGQVRINDIAGPDVVVEVNIGGSLAADMQIRLTATTLASMTASDFLL